VSHASTEGDFATAFTATVRKRAGALFVTRDPSSPVGALNWWRWPQNADLPDVHRQAGVYTGRILKGARPADLPILQPNKFDLVINRSPGPPGNRGECCPCGHDCIDPETDQFRSERREALRLAGHPAGLGQKMLPVDVADIAQSDEECGHGGIPRLRATHVRCR
jgi:hypothetical protein